MLSENQACEVRLKEVISTQNPQRSVKVIGVLKGSLFVKFVQDLTFLMNMNKNANYSPCHI